MADDGRHWMAERVSRETMQRLIVLDDLLARYQKTINLVAPSTLATSWTRHFKDSAQLLDHAPRPMSHWLDLGSGAGFPGLVIAAIARETHPDLRVTLVESDLRKCGFLREAARQMGVTVGILSRRIEDIPPQGADVVSARALASLSALVALAKRNVTAGGVLLFPKGAGYMAELEALAPEWQAMTDVLPSLTDPEAAILRIRIPAASESG